MALRLGVSNLIDAGSGLPFAAIGLFALLRRPSTPRTRWVGGAALSWGILVVFLDAVALAPDLGNIVYGTLDLLTVVLTVGLALHLVSTTSQRARRAWWAMSGIVLIAATWTAWLYAQPLFAPASIGTFGVVFFLASQLVLASACATRLGNATEREARALGLLALGFGLFGWFFLAPFPSGWAQDLPLYVAGISSLLLWIPQMSGPHPRVARRTFLALVAAAIVGLLFFGPFDVIVRDISSDDLGANGIIRATGGLLLSIAIFRYDLLGVPLPDFARARGALVAGALATLFIVAQVAQNFFAAQYGLLLGGVVAGAFLFAANPVQRAIEGRGRPAAPDLDDKRLATYREAVGYALRDGTVTRKEEAHLADLAQHLSIGAGDAMRVRHEVEDARRDHTRP